MKDIDFHESQEKIINYFGFQDRCIKLAEEMAELFKAIQLGDVENIKEEIADNYVVIYQMMLFFGFDEQMSIARKKVHRTIDRCEL